jgi:hypothetical protein
LRITLSAMGEHCCERMTEAVTSRCEEHADRWDCPDALVAYRPEFKEYGLMIHDGGTSTITIDYCPFCGAKLPTSSRAD